MAQTKHEIQSLLAGAGTEPRHRFGQNFMIDQNLVRLVAEAGELTPDDVVIEVGPGTGTLTEELLARAGRAMRVLAPAPSPALGAAAAQAPEEAEAAIPPVAIAAADATNPSTHTVSRGESAWKIAHRYHLSVSQLLARNGLGVRSRLHPGMILKLDAGASE